MAGYTIRNLHEVEDAAPKFGLSGIEARFARESLECEKSGLSYQRFEPNVRIPFGHSHAEQEELYVIIGGSGRLKLGDDVIEVKPLDAVRVAGELMRAFEAGPDGLELIAFGAPQAVGDAEMVPGWWSD